MGRACSTNGEQRNAYRIVRLEVFTAMAMKNGVFWGVTLCGSCKN
jgi:hypothetical protein